MQSSLGSGSSVGTQRSPAASRMIVGSPQPGQATSSVVLGDVTVTESQSGIGLAIPRQPESSVRVEGENRSYVNVSESTRRRWPPHGWLGLALVGAFWTLNWSLAGLRTHWAFFPSGWDTASRWTPWSWSARAPRC